MKLSIPVTFDRMKMQFIVSYRIVTATEDHYADSVYSPAQRTVSGRFITPPSELRREKIRHWTATRDSRTSRQTVVVATTWKYSDTVATPGSGTSGTQNYMKRFCRTYYIDT